MAGGTPPDRAWFLPKKFGIGSGWPIAWQGWALLVAHMALLGAVARRFENNLPNLIMFAIIIAIMPLPLYAWKTRGGWRWRWNSRD